MAMSIRIATKSLRSAVTVTLCEVSHRSDEEGKEITEIIMGIRFKALLNETSEREEEKESRESKAKKTKNEKLC